MHRRVPVILLAMACSSGQPDVEAPTPKRHVATASWSKVTGSWWLHIDLPDRANLVLLQDAGNEGYVRVMPANTGQWKLKAGSHDVMTPLDGCFIPPGGGGVPVPTTGGTEGDSTIKPAETPREARMMRLGYVCDSREPDEFPALVLVLGGPLVTPARIDSMLPTLRWSFMDEKGRADLGAAIEGIAIPVRKP